MDSPIHSTKAFSTPQMGAVLWNCSRLFSIVSVLLTLCIWGCAMFITRPSQLMSDTTAALRAAQQAQAEVLAPELYRQSLEWYFKAKNEYMMKNFKLATEYANRSRTLAEEAEFTAIKNGAKMEAPPPDLSAEEPVKPHEEYPTPTGTPADVFEDRKTKEESQKKNAGS